jgi:hypothetical protein
MNETGWSTWSLFRLILLDKPDEDGPANIIIAQSAWFEIILAAKKYHRERYSIVDHHYKVEIRYPGEKWKKWKGV